MYSIEEAPYCLHCPLKVCYEDDSAEQHNITKSMCSIPEDLIKHSALSKQKEDIIFYLDKPRRIKELADLVGVHTSTIQQWVRIGKLTVKRFSEIGTRKHTVHRLYVVDINSLAW